MKCESDAFLLSTSLQICSINRKLQELLAENRIFPMPSRTAANRAGCCCRMFCLRFWRPNVLGHGRCQAPHATQNDLLTLLVFSWISPSHPAEKLCSCRSVLYHGIYANIFKRKQQNNKRIRDMIKYSQRRNMCRWINGTLTSINLHTRKQHFVAVGATVSPVT